MKKKNASKPTIIIVGMILSELPQPKVRDKGVLLEAWNPDPFLDKSNCNIFQI